MLRQLKPKLMKGFDWFLSPNEFSHRDQNLSQIRSTDSNFAVCFRMKWMHNISKKRETLIRIRTFWFLVHHSGQFSPPFCLLLWCCVTNSPNLILGTWYKWVICNSHHSDLQHHRSGHICAPPAIPETLTHTAGAVMVVMRCWTSSRIGRREKPLL